MYTSLFVTDDKSQDTSASRNRVVFYLQILISWNRFARTLKEAFELYWETKQV